MQNEVIKYHLLEEQDLLKACRIETFRSSGKGGQHVNKTESAVRIVHLPTGITASCQNNRSQNRNKQVCLERLREKLKRYEKDEKPRVPTKIPRREKEKRLSEKKRRSQLKEQRKRPDEDD
tara:strand:+ start:120 stop:482 length:363 start_codon:yes stop_codon:yes gene_type:complete